ncbi:MAG: hypothetical protein A2270_07410 [Elusimicrobia bacterium RIFOXYA12_FULL_51_18]|nr:MAG: hypothetical protein A2270_07410 [Elusimicrobia bacterium RIFOXYA12_FULL_51_18]OGS28509.1 MAG: hypothetical protein A2218_05715 [Elusimicrobia bacterium RIFOXYA2_FULL_53_38]
MSLGKFISYCILAAAVLYCCLTFFPKVLFSNTYRYKNITVYTRAPVTGPTDAVLTRVYDAVVADDFFDPGQKFEIYLAGGYAEYTFLAPFCRKTGACVHPATNKIFIASSDFDKNQAYGREAGLNPRILESVMIHELVLAQLKNNFGAMNYIALKPWLKDGYAEHIARETVEMDPAAICGERDKNAPLIPYLESRLILNLVKGEAADLTYPAFMKENSNYESLLKRVMERYCSK